MCGSCLRRTNIDVVNVPACPDARRRALRKTMAGKRRSESSCLPRRRPAMLPFRFCTDGERCVCSPGYYFLASTHHLQGGRRLWLGGEPGTTSPHGDRHERFWYASSGRGAAIWTWRTRAGIFRARSRRRGKRRPRTCVCHSELAAGFKSCSSDLPELRCHSSWNSLNRVVTPYLDKWNSALRPPGGGGAEAPEPPLYAAVPQPRSVSTGSRWNSQPPPYY